jgi:hypothetical protein
MTVVVHPSGVTAMGGDAFSGCSPLESVRLPAACARLEDRSVTATARVGAGTRHGRDPVSMPDDRLRVRDNGCDPAELLGPRRPYVLRLRVPDNGHNRGWLPEHRRPALLGTGHPGSPPLWASGLSASPPGMKP